jgi:hypothetical protein
MKKLFFILIVIVCTNCLFAQTDTGIIERKNALALKISIIGVEGSYERYLNNYFSLLFDASYTYSIANEYTASLKTRFYPKGMAFFLDFGLGYTYGIGFTRVIRDTFALIMIFPILSDYNFFERTHGLLVQLGLGSKHNIVKSGKWKFIWNAGLDTKVLHSEIPDFSPYARAGVEYTF